MNAPAPRARRGAHRTTRDLATALVPSLLAVLAVAALATALYVWHGQDATPDQAVASTSKASTTSTPTASASPRPPASSTASTPTPTATASTTAGAQASPSSTASRLQVVVLNQTRRAGLAARAAERLRARGWVVR